MYFVTKFFWPTLRKNFFCLCPQAKSQSGTKYTRAGLVSLKDFWLVSGWLKNELDRKRKKDLTKFKWDDDDQGTIQGGILELSYILNASKSPFKDFRIETKRSYDWRNCNQKMTRPCPYYYTAIASLVAPIVLALVTISIIICLSKCCKHGYLIDFIWYSIW